MQISKVIEKKLAYVHYHLQEPIKHEVSQFVRLIPGKYTIESNIYSIGKIRKQLQ